MKYRNFAGGKITHGNKRNKFVCCACVSTKSKALKSLQCMFKLQFHFTPSSMDPGAGLGTLPRTGNQDLTKAHARAWRKGFQVTQAHIHTRLCCMLVNTLGVVLLRVQIQFSAFCLWSLQHIQHRLWNMQPPVAFAALSVRGGVWALLTRQQGWGIRFCSFSISQHPHLAHARVSSTYVKFLPYPATQSSHSSPLNWGKKTSNTQVYTNNPVIEPGRTKGDQAPSTMGQEMAAGSGRTVSCCRLPCRKPQKGEDTNLQFLSWKFPTAAFTTK